MTGLLQVCRDLAVGVLEDKFAVSPAVVEGCEIFLAVLTDVKSDPSILPREGGFSASLKRPIEDELLTSWLASVAAVGERAPISSATQRKSHTVLARGLSEKAHLVLFAPIAYKLLACPHGEIRDLAHALSANVDLGSLVASYTELLDRVDGLNAENERLRLELHQLKSSQHLSF